MITHKKYNIIIGNENSDHIGSSRDADDAEKDDSCFCIFLFPAQTNQKKKQQKECAYPKSRVEMVPVKHRILKIVKKTHIRIADGFFQRCKNQFDIKCGAPVGFKCMSQADLRFKFNDVQDACKCPCNSVLKELYSCFFDGFALQQIVDGNQ